MTPGVIDRTLQAFGQTTIQRRCHTVVVGNTLIGEFANSTKTRIWRRGGQGTERTHFAVGIETVLLNREITAVVADISQRCHRLVTERLLHFQVPFCVSGILEAGHDSVVVGTRKSWNLSLNAAQCSAVGKCAFEGCVIGCSQVKAATRAEDRYPRACDEEHRDGGRVSDEQVGQLGGIEIAENPRSATNDHVPSFRREGKSEARLPDHALQTVKELTFSGLDRLIVRTVHVVADGVKTAREFGETILQAGQVAVPIDSQRSRELQLVVHSPLILGVPAQTVAVERIMGLARELLSDVATIRKCAEREVRHAAHIENSGLISRGPVS